MADLTVYLSYQYKLKEVTSTVRYCKIQGIIYGAVQCSMLLLKTIFLLLPSAATKVTN